MGSVFRQKDAWKEAGWTFGMSRLAIIVISLFTVGTMPDVLGKIGQDCKIPAICMFYHWDVIHYVQIAAAGYSSKVHAENVAFFPLWPLIEYLGGSLLGGQNPEAYLLAGMVVANLCFYLVLVLLYWLVCEDFDASTARRTLYYLAFSPFSFFFFLAYTESLFVLLSVGCFMLLRRNSMWAWWGVGALGFLATLTRSSGLALAVPMLVCAVERFLLPSSGAERWQRWRRTFVHLIPMVLIPMGLLMYMFYLWQTQKDPFAFSYQQGLGWGRHVALPWVGLQWALDLIVNPIIMFSPFIDLWTRIHNMLNGLFTILALLVLRIGWRRLPPHYTLFAATLLLFALSVPVYPYQGDMLVHLEPLMSLPRLLLAAFPVTIICAIWGKYPRFDFCYMTVALPFFSAATIMFLTNYWVV